MMPETPFLSELFSQLNSQNIRYCVLRDYESLPQTTGSHDLDLLVDPKDFMRCFKIICDTAQRYGGKRVIQYRAGAIMLRFCGTIPHWWGVALDLDPNISNKGIPYYDSHWILDHQTLHGYIPVASKEDAAMSAFFKECLANGRDRKSYAQKAAFSHNHSEHYFQPILRALLGNQAAKLCSKQLLKLPENPENTATLCRFIQKSLRRQAIRTSPFKIGFKRLKLLWSYRQRIHKPPGFMVAFLGTDGSGKSTVIEAILPTLNQTLHGLVLCQHSRPHVLPPLATLFSPKNATQSIPHLPHTAPASGIMGSLLRISYYGLDYLFGYWFKLFPFMVFYPSLFIFDRYYYDYLIDPKRSRINLPQPIIRFILMFLPKPDLVLCLGTDPKTIHQRKPELPLKEVQHQVKALKNLCNQLPNGHWIDTGTSPEEARDQTLIAIVEAMANRYPPLADQD